MFKYLKDRTFSVLVCAALATFSFGVIKNSVLDSRLLTKYNSILTKYADYDKNRIISDDETVKLWREATKKEDYYIIGDGKFCYKSFRGSDIDINLIDKEGKKKYLLLQDQINLLERFVEDGN
jgi:hypothetical protein